jgi:membrane protein implicated in regulation of membrane protease activity
MFVAMDEPDDQLIGRTATVSLAIDPARAGEVMIGIRGGTEAFTAVSDEPIAKHARVVVIDRLSARMVSVTPLP